MKILGKVHLLFEQSGVFRDEFRKMGYEAFDYDIQDGFGKTDFKVDLFGEIEAAYDDRPSVFDNMTGEDLVMAFFPCTYFESMQMPYYSYSTNNLRNMDIRERHRVVIDRIEKREKMYILLHKLYALARIRGLRLIIENPATQPHYLLFAQNFIKPTYIDSDRTLRGDYYKKPTAYWFVNCERTAGYTWHCGKEKKLILESGKNVSGLSERSLFSPDYARNFINDCILGKKSDVTENDLLGYLLSTGNNIEL